MALIGVRGRRGGDAIGRLGVRCRWVRVGVWGRRAVKDELDIHAVVGGCMSAMMKGDEEVLGWL